MKLKACLAVICAAMLLIGAYPATAQFVVIDPANLIQNTLTALRELQQIQNEIQQLENEAKNLEHLNFNSLGSLQAILATTQRLLNQSQGIAFTLAQAQATFTKFYPNAYNGSSSDQMIADAQARWTNSHEALRTAVQMQAQANENFPQDQAVLANLVASSQAADGALQAMQAGNQLLALQAKQLIQAQQIAVAQDRAVAIEQARAVEAQERSRVMRLGFMTGQTNYGPVPIRVFP
jgi:P-type conjugative transfer protein TrbJ